MPKIKSGGGAPTNLASISQTQVHVWHHYLRNQFRSGLRCLKRHVPFFFFRHPERSETQWFWGVDPAKEVQ